MIKFTCHCNHVFEFPEEMAGRQVQCPQCQRLVDIPTTDELAQISEDGTFRIDERDEPPIAGVAGIQLGYARNTDDDGTDIDLRQTPEEIAAAGTTDDIFEFEHHPTAPKYDPETGELIRPMDIAEEPPEAKPAQLPMASNMLDYSKPGLMGDNDYSPLIRLFSPINLVVMFFVLLGHIFFYFTAFSVYLAVAAILFVAPALIAHYANVVEEIGIDERDELPRFLRHFNFWDDVWHPFVHVFLAWMICFGIGDLIWLFWVYHHNWPLAPGIIAISVTDFIGLIFFPAVALTTTTSGSIENLRPDRILRVIATIGPAYARLVILYAVAIFIYSMGMFTVPIQALMLAAMVKNPPMMYRFGFAYGSLAVGIFLMHYFAWLLGLYYRRLHPKFPWVYHQRERVIPGVTERRFARPVRRVPAHPPRTQG